MGGIAESLFIHMGLAAQSEPPRLIMNTEEAMQEIMAMITTSLRQAGARYIRDESIKPRGGVDLTKERRIKKPPGRWMKKGTKAATAFDETVAEESKAHKEKFLADALAHFDKSWAVSSKAEL